MLAAVAALVITAATAETRAQTTLSPVTLSPGAPQVSGGNVMLDSTLDASGGPVMAAGNVTLFPGFVGQLSDAPAIPHFEVTIGSGSPLADGEALDFGTVGLSMPRTRIVTVRNLGTGAVPLILNFSLQNAFSQDGYGFGAGAPSSPVTLGLDETVTIPITLLANDPGTFGGNLVVVDSENPDSSLRLSLTGTVLNQPHTIFEWNSADGDWDQDFNWNPDQVPPPTKTLNAQAYASNVSISNGGIARKTGGAIKTGTLSISNGSLVLTDGADVENFLFQGSTRVDTPISLGENGTLRIGDGGAPGGSLLLTKQIQSAGGSGPGAMIVFNHDDPAYSFAPRIVGDIGVLQEGPGTTVLSTSMVSTTGNLHSGGNTVTGGLLEVAANSAFGATGSPLHLDGGGIRWRALFNDLRAFTLGPNGGTLDTNGFAPTYAHVIPQTGSFSKTGSGTLTLTQPHTVSTPWSVSGGSLVFDANMTFAPGSALSGPVELNSSTLTLEGSSRSIGGIQFRSTISILTSNGDIAVNGLLNFTNQGKIRTTTPGSKLTVQGGMSLNTHDATFDGRIVELASNTNHIRGSVQLLNGAILNNHADSIWDAKGDFRINAGGTFNNAGTFKKTEGTGTFEIFSAFTNTGLVDVQRGTLSLKSGGTFTNGTFKIADQAGLSFDGVSVFGAGAVFDVQPGSLLTFASVSETTFETSRVFDCDVEFQGKSLTLDGDTIFNEELRMHVASTARLTGSGNIVTNGLLSITNQGKIHSATPGATLTVQGGLLLDSFSADVDGRIVELASDTEHIRGQINLLNGAVIHHHAGSIWSAKAGLAINNGTFNNAGTFAKNEGTGDYTISSAFINTGTVNAMTGTLAFSGAYTQTAGTLHLNGGSIRKTVTPLNIAGGSVRGSGTIDGNIDVNGGRIVLEIAGNSPGINQDQLVITGTTAFDTGIIEVAFIDGFTPQAGQEFVLLVSAGFSGTPQLVVTGLAPGWQFSTQYDPGTDEFKLTSVTDGVAGGGAPLSISALSFAPPPGGTEGKSVSATASGPPGAVVRLEASSNLVQWTTIATETIGSFGNTSFDNIHDPLAGERRFYRLATP